MRVHRLSPMIGVARSGIALLALLLIREDFRTFVLGHLSTWWIALLAIAGFFAVMWLISGIWWRATRFEIGEEITFENGVFLKNSRSAKRENIQAVDVVEPFLARLFGLAELRIETAGGVDSVIAISYLRPKQAHELREQILAQHAAQAEAQTSAEEDAEGSAPARGIPEEMLARERTEPDIRIPESRALIGSALQQLPRFALIVAAFLLMNLAGLGLIAIAFMVGPPLFRRLDQAWRMELRFSDTLHLTYGLANRSHNAIPLHRVHAASVKQYPMWRFTDWWEVTLAVSGYTDNTTVLPVGTREEVEEVLQRIFGRGMDFDAMVSSPKQAMWVSPIDWKQQGGAVDQDHVMVSHGRIAPKRVIVNRADIQALALEHGPLQKKLGLAHLDCKVVHGPVTAKIKDLRTADAQALMEQLRVGE